ncbi:PPOX class F420-dependent oxidoreductase [Flindersiella endophytica]
MASDSAQAGLDRLANGHAGVLVTLKRDGRPQLSNVSYTYADGVIRVSITDDRAKTRNLRRDPRASFYVSANFGEYLVAEGDAELTLTAQDPHDSTVDELVDVYRQISGEHPDWEEFRAAMVADKRVALRIKVSRVLTFSQTAGATAIDL